MDATPLFDLVLRGLQTACGLGQGLVEREVIHAVVDAPVAVPGDAGSTTSPLRQTRRRNPDNNLRAMRPA